jgi:hypothetical protein
MACKRSGAEMRPNFARIDQMLKASPAMAAGVTDRLLEALLSYGQMPLCPSPLALANEREQDNRAEDGTGGQEQQQKLRAKDAQHARKQLDRYDRNGKADAVYDRESGADEMAGRVARIQCGELRRVANNDHAPKDKKAKQGSLR